jgi:hypothetical protein
MKRIAIGDVPTSLIVLVFSLSGQHSRHYESLPGDEEVRIPLWKFNDRVAAAPEVQHHL